MFILVSGIATLFHQIVEQGKRGAFVAWLDKHSHHGAWFDMVTVGHHWVTFNIVPTCVHILWGVCTGKLLMTVWSRKKKLLIMLLTGIAGITARYLQGLFIPMAERISTGSFVVLSGCWCVLAMGLSYLFVDILRFGKIRYILCHCGHESYFYLYFQQPRQEKSTHPDGPSVYVSSF